MPAPEASVNFLTAQQTTEQTTTSATYGDVSGAVTPTLVSGARYMMWVYAKIGGSNVNQLYSFKLVDTTLPDDTDMAGSEKVLEPGSASQYASYSYCTVFTAQSAGTVKMQFKANDGATTSKVRFAEFVLIQLNTPGAELIEGQDWWIVEDATATTLGTSPQTFANRTLSASVASTTAHYTNRINGESWAFWGHTAINYNNGSYQCNTNLVVDGTTVTGSQEPEDPNEVSCDWLQQAIDFGDANDKALSITASDEHASAANQYVSSRLVALRLEVFASYLIDQDLTAYDSTSTSWLTNLDGSFTPSTTGKAIAIGCSVFDGGGTGRHIYQKLLIDTAAHWGTSMSGTGSGTTRDGTDELPYQFATVISGSASTEFDYDWQWSKGSSASHGIEDRCLVMFTPELAGFRKTWDGSADGALNTPANWSGGAAPSKEDTVLFAENGTNAPASSSLTCKRVFFGKGFTQQFGGSTSLSVSAEIVTIDSPDAKLHITPTVNDLRVRAVRDVNPGLYLLGTIRNLYLLNPKGPVEVLDTARLFYLFVMGSRGVLPNAAPYASGKPVTLTIGNSQSDTGSVARCEGVFDVDQQHGGFKTIQIYGPGRYILKDEEDDETTDILLASGALLDFRGTTITGTVDNYQAVFSCSDNKNSQLDFGSAINGWGGIFIFDNEVGGANTTAFSGTTVTAHSSQTRFGQDTLTPST